MCTHKSIFTLLLIFLSASIFAQRDKKSLPPNINQPSLNLFAPAISGDGETLIYLSDYTDNGSQSMYFATRKSVSSWNDATEVSKAINNPKLNYRGGYSLSFDGDQLFITSRKSGIGGFDLWYSERQGNNWGPLKNLGKPVNSVGNEGTASISPDGKWLYFMRCNQMDEFKGASGCKIMVSKLKYGKWDAPIELPSNINTGNSQNPKILADGETLIFSSDKMGGKGGLDLFMSKKVGGKWQDPKPMAFINSEKNDQFISIPAKGRYLYTSQHSGRDYDIVQLLIPEEFKPKSVMRIKGQVTDLMTKEPVNARLTIFDVDLRDRIWNDKVGEKGEFAIVLNEGSNYDLSFTHPDGSYKYYAKVYALENIGRRDRQTLSIELGPIEKNKEYESNILFRDHSSEIDDKSTYELRRLVDMLKKNPQMQIELNVSQTNYREDSINIDPDLTELMVDTTYVEKQVPIIKDSLMSSVSDTLTINALAETDSLQTNVMQYDTITEIKVINTYHNDRSKKQAENIRRYLIEKGIDTKRIKIQTHKMRRPEDHQNSDVVFNDVYVSVKVLEI